MLKQRVISSFFIFIFLFFAINNQLFFTFFFIHFLSFFALWEFFRLNSFRTSNRLLDKKDQILNNFFLTRVKLTVTDYFHIFCIQILLILYKNFEFLFISFILIYFLYLILTLKKNIYKYLGLVYLSLPFFCFIYLQKIDQLMINFMIIFIITIATDIGGYVIGKSIKGPKISKRISPKKTWSGFVGSILFSLVFCEFFFENALINIGVFSLIVLFSLICQVGDFIESYFKRLCFIKESSNLIPGHGGILDRLDGAILLTTFIFILNIFQINFINFFNL